MGLKGEQFERVRVAWMVVKRKGGFERHSEPVARYPQAVCDRQVKGRCGEMESVSEQH